ncbi:GPI-linked NAD(P)(+)--arginine ADP-ribosyltransferase 1-like [Bacillus rossius redtenbacheri]|uniref:GPI-linked NAD(P)(+)--arginine ADP-ribosyltransferase 1-like n=1 Tax=Bacillus rossius redtenbacheri TaxID=93214 RepID=UPI002FDED6DB
MAHRKKVSKPTSRYVDNDFPAGNFSLGREDFYDFIDDQHYGCLSPHRLASQFTRQIKSCGIDFDYVYDEFLLDLDSRENIQKSAVKLFACDEPKARPLYKQFNEATRAALQREMSLRSYKFGLFFWLLNCIYEKRNTWRQTRLYRGVNCEFNFSLRNSVFSFNQFVSFSGQKNIAMKFLSEGGTLFFIDGVSQMPISRYSPFPSEDEHLIHPDQAFKIVNVSMCDNLAVAQLKVHN